MGRPDGVNGGDRFVEEFVHDVPQAGFEVEAAAIAEGHAGGDDGVAGRASPVLVTWLPRLDVWGGSARRPETGGQRRPDRRLEPGARTFSWGVTLADLQPAGRRARMSLASRDRRAGYRCVRQTRSEVTRRRAGGGFLSTFRVGGRGGRIFLDTGHEEPFAALRTSEALATDTVGQVENDAAARAMCRRLGHGRGSGVESRWDVWASRSAASGDPSLGVRILPFYSTDLRGLAGELDLVASSSAISRGLVN